MQEIWDCYQRRIRGEKLSSFWWRRKEREKESEREGKYHQIHFYKKLKPRIVSHSIYEYNYFLILYKISKIIFNCKSDVFLFLPCLMQMAHNKDPNNECSTVYYTVHISRHCFVVLSVGFTKLWLTNVWDTKNDNYNLNAAWKLIILFFIDFWTP